MAYVSITGLRLTSVIHAPRFWWHALRSMAQAKSAPGLISADARTIDGVHHTLTIWETREAMRAFLVTGAHIKAMKTFKSIASGSVLGFETDQPPGWNEAHALWRAHGREV
ncbi:hypothetical protein [Aestuariivirga litoralis]|uniref:hypothetical protein n=1 Tax=Aestuariivirga litoralis TaxID=2650924 RepID=UPI0018C7E960|nr:hypothetical protein [Aestuariivirga litoralis]MBG1233375.1 hypothetical protein [Aestuariivirga litoralis]